MRIINVVVGFVAPVSLSSSPRVCRDVLILLRLALPHLRWSLVRPDSPSSHSSLRPDSRVSFVWCTTTITTTRLVINIRKMSEAPDDDDDEPATPLPLTKSPSRKRRTPLPYDEQSIDDRGLGPRNSKFSEYSRSSVSEAAHHSNAVSSYSCSNFGSGNYGGRAAPPASRTTATGAFEHVEHIDLTPIRPRSIGGGGAWVEPKSWRRSESANGHHGRGHSERSFGDMSEEDGSVLDIGRFK